MKKFFLVMAVIGFMAFLLFANANAAYLDHRPSLRTAQLWVAWILSIVAGAMAVYGTVIGIKK